MMKGSITIYLLLSLVLVFAVICTLTESARVSCMNARLRGITYMAADSCFAEFAEEVFDEYGIMALWKNDSELTASFNGYVHANLDKSDLGLFESVNLFPMSHENSALGTVVHMTDQGGFPFEKQVYEYMDFFLIREALEKFLSYVDIYGAGKKVASFLSKMMEYKDDFLKVANAVAKIQKTVDKVKSMAFNPVSSMGKMKYGLDMYRTTDSNSYLSYFYSGYRELASKKEKMNRYLEQIGDQTQDYYRLADIAGEDIARIQEILDTEGSEFDAELLEGLQSQIDDLKLKTSDRDSDYYHIRQNADLAAKLSDKIRRLDGLLTSVDPSSVMDNAGIYSGIVAGYSGLFFDADPGMLGLNVSEYSGKKQSGGFMAVIGYLFSEGLLKAVAGDHISKNKISLNHLPSSASSKGKAPDAAQYSGPFRRLQFGEYVVNHFGSFTDPSGENALQYEIEYILAGKKSDKDNLKTVAADLVLMRAGLNMASFFKDPVKMSEAQLLAEAVIGFTGMELLVQMIKLVIISLWCIAESLCDVKTLMAGGKIPILKENSNWTVSVSALAAFKRTLLPSFTDEAGLSYEDHLRILLYLENKTKRTFRTMDIIQANACKKYNAGFRMDQCIASIQIHAVYSAGQLFTGFGFVKQLVGNGSGRYSFQYIQEYAY